MRILSVVPLLLTALQDAEWIGDRGLAAWRKPSGAWADAGDVGVDPGNGRRLKGTEGRGVLVNGPEGKTSNLFSAEEHGDVELHVEFMVPKGSNSGLYFQGRYEIQIFDSFGKEHAGHSDCGGIYQRWDPARGKGQEGFEGRAPRVNASKPPGEWQSLDVVFRAPRFDADGRKTEAARFVKVSLNGTLIHENVEVGGPTRAAAWNDEKPRGPLMIQGDHGPVALRNLRVRSIPAGD
jgi:hypothetical protein